MYSDKMITKNTKVSQKRLENLILTTITNKKDYYIYSSGHKSDKSIKRKSELYKTDASKLQDLFRITVVSNSLSKLYDSIYNLEKKMKVSNFEITKQCDLFKTDEMYKSDIKKIDSKKINALSKYAKIDFGKFFGFVNIHFHVLDKTTGLIGEVQFHLCKIFKIVNIIGHQVYEITRALSNTPEDVRSNKTFEKLMIELYEHVYKFPEKYCIEDLKALLDYRNQLR